MQRLTCRHLILVCAMLMSINSIGQVNWYWTEQADSAEEFAAYDAVDRNNNAYYTGYCIGTRISFGNIGLNITGTEDDFLVKYSPNGSVLWARNATALSPSSNITAQYVAIDSSNNVIETGYIND